MTQYTQERVTADLLDRMWPNLWQRGRDEMAQLGLTPDEAFDDCLHMGQNADDGFILCADGEPVLVTGTVADGAEHFTFFQATDAFQRHAKTITRLIRQKVRASPHRIVIYSTLCHPDAAGWFRLLGFERDGWEGTTVLGVPTYRFRRV